MQKSVIIHAVFIVTAFLMSAVCSPGCDKSPAPPGTPVAVSNSLLECAAKDLLGESTPILRLAEPGMCPGHFDIRPSMVQQLRSCRVLLRLDFQKAMDAKLSNATDAGLRIVEIHIPGGLCEPKSYLAACQQTAEAIINAGLLKKDVAAERLRRIADRLETLSSQCRKDAAFLKNAPVVASVHQEAFCKWLGLDVVATFRGADVESTRRLDEALKTAKQKHVRIIIANRPEGRRCADFLAESLGAKVAMFDNFPALNNGQNSFDDMLRDNVTALQEAAK